MIVVHKKNLSTPVYQTHSFVIIVFVISEQILIWNLEVGGGGANISRNKNK
jgi:hypothetical protein